MPKLLILADDLTGALDSGVQLVHKGEKVIIYTKPDHAEIPDRSADVLVINTDTRHVSKDYAYQVIYRLAKQAKNMGIRCIYKKTDSGLRGNIGMELKAVLDATGERRINFVPAYPKLNRITRKGIQYINGVPLAESFFAEDIIDPVKYSRIDELIQSQCDVPVSLDGKDGIVVYDCESENDLQAIAEKLEKEEGFRLAAGCAGLLEMFPTESTGVSGEIPPDLYEELLVLSGSMNPVTLKQLETAEKNGALRSHVPMEKIVRDIWQEEEITSFVGEFLNESKDRAVAIVDTNDSCRIPEEHINENLTDQIARTMGKLAQGFVKADTSRTMMIIGGDTLLGFIQAMNINLIQPVTEITPGTVLARYDLEGVERYVITKSGAFGSGNLFEQIRAYLAKGENKCQ